MLNELIASASHASTQAFVGVGLIALYFCLIVVTAMCRIKKGEHMHH